MKEYKIGFHVRTYEELHRVIRIPGVNLIELKPDHLARKSEYEIYTFDGKEFKPRTEVISNLKNQIRKKGIDAHIHLPFEETYDPSQEKGLCQAAHEHHDLLLQRFDMFGQLKNQFIQDHNDPLVITVHPPAFKLEGQERWGVKRAIKAGKELYERVDKLIKEKGYNMIIGLENMVDPKEMGTVHVGYEPKQIDQLISHTSEIGITIDTGHRRLADAMSVSKLLSYGEIVEFHLHSNSGEKDPETWDDDEHELATEDNLPHYNRFLKRFRRSKIPIILEISDTEDTEKMAKYIENLMKQIRNEK